MAVKNMFQLEYLLKTSPGVLFPMISTPSGLSDWFADDVSIRGNIFTFFWDGSSQQAEMLQKKNNTYIRFRWLEEDDEEAFFEFRLHTDELTGETALVITDYAEEDEKDDAIELWDTQIDNLRRVLGL